MKQNLPNKQLKPKHRDYLKKLGEHVQSYNDFYIWTNHYENKESQFLSQTDSFPLNTACVNKLWTYEKLHVVMIWSDGKSIDWVSIIQRM